MHRVSWAIRPVSAALAAVAFGALRLRMRRIEKLSRRAAELPGGDIGERLPEEETPCEIQPLVCAMNAALDRAERAYAAQRSFSVEAARQTRTPLAVFVTRAELIQDRRTAEALGADIAAPERIVDQLLALAGVDVAQTGRPGEPVDLVALARLAANFPDRPAAKRGVDLASGAAPCPVTVRGHEGALVPGRPHRAAERHRPQPARRRGPAFRPGAGDGRGRGPGRGRTRAPADLAYRRLRRVQADRSGRRRRGAGLGLSTVRRVAEPHHGTVSLRAAPGNGAPLRPTMPVGYPVGARDVA